MADPFHKVPPPSLAAADPLKNPHLLKIAAIVNEGDWDYTSVEAIADILTDAGFNLDWDHINATNS
jgi:hypothetical protein